MKSARLLHALAASRTAWALAAIVVLAGCAGVSDARVAHAHASTTAAGSSAPRAGDRAEGDALARQLLARLTLPPGSRRLAAGIASLSPGSSPAPWAADLHREFSLPMRESAAISFQYAHAPAGLRPDGNGGIISYGPPAVQEYDWSERTLPRGIASVELAEMLQPDRGRTLVRFDVQVIWYPARPAADFLVPAKVSSVTVLTTEFVGIQTRSFVRKISSRPEIGRLISLFDSLPGAIGRLFCVLGTNYQLDIAIAGGRRLQVQAGHCTADVMTAAGHARFVLWDPGNRLAALVASLTRAG